MTKRLYPNDWLYDESPDDLPPELAWADWRYRRIMAVLHGTEQLPRPDIEAYRAYVEKVCPDIPAPLTCVRAQGDFPPEVSSDPTENDKAFAFFEDRLTERAYVEAGGRGQSIAVGPRLWWWQERSAFHVGPNVRCLVVVLTTPWVAAPRPILSGEEWKGVAKESMTLGPGAAAAAERIRQHLRWKGEEATS